MKLSRIAITDTETSGLDPKEHPCLEVAVIIYDVASATPISSFSSLIHASENAAEHVNRIPVAALQAAPLREHVWETVRLMTQDCDAYLAHHAAFDASFYPPSLASALPWIDSANDLLWPKSQAVREKLVVLALNHDLGVAYAHRALADCELLSRLLTRVHELGHDLEPFLARGLRPKKLVAAMVPFEQRDKPRVAGFTWHPEPIRQWRKSVAIDDIPLLGFPVKDVT